jgi:hypothetical protein
MNAIKILVGKPESKKPCWAPWYKWKDNIKMDLTEIGCEVVV